MKTSDNGVQFIKNAEGVRLKAYKAVPTEKYWTIGVGHYSKEIQPGMKITLKEALEYLREDLVRFENAVNKLNLNLNQNQFDALVSFTFNCGEGSLRSLVKNRTKIQIADALLKYNKSGGKVIDGLTKRRKKERELFLSGINLKEKPEEEIIQETTVPVVQKPEKDTLPYKVKVKTILNIRTGPSCTAPVMKKAQPGDILIVWAIKTNGNQKWAKNKDEWFCLDYCEKIK